MFFLLSTQNLGSEWQPVTLSRKTSGLTLVKHNYTPNYFLFFVPFFSFTQDFLLMLRYKNKTPVICSRPISVCVCVCVRYLCSSPSSSFLYALISISRASFTSNSSWYSLSWAFILSLSSLISCSFPSMSLRCLSRSADRISSSSLIRFSDVATYKCTTHTES